MREVVNLPGYDRRNPAAPSPKVGCGVPFFFNNRVSGSFLHATQLHLEGTE
jgi:hypothetical protein